MEDIVSVLRVDTLDIVVLREVAYLAIRNPRRAGGTNMIVQTSCPISNVNSFNFQRTPRARCRRSWLYSILVVTLDLRLKLGYRRKRTA